MVITAKNTIQRGPSRGRISVIHIQNFTVEKRRAVIKAFYGTLLVVIAVIILAINPIELATNWLLDMKEGSFLFTMWQKPPYEVYSEVWVYNYTNVPQFLSGEDKVLKLEEVGPFKFQEIRTNENITIDAGSGAMTIRPKITLKFLREESFSDPKDTSIHVPNIALISMSTLAADKLGYIVNTGAYYSMSALGAKLFRILTVNELFWGFHDPLVTIANSLLPGWIDFSKLGILDRLYAQRSEVAELELKDISKRFSIKTWNHSPGIKEQGFTDMNTSTHCNRIQGTYEGLMFPPKFPKGKDIPIFRTQACRVYPLNYQEEVLGEHGFNFYRYTMAKSAFSKESPYACACRRNCLPEGFVDVSECYYGFPIALSKPHFMDVDSVQQSYYEGMHPDPVKHTSHFDIEPKLGVPLATEINIQVNLAVRTSLGNPITKPLKDKVLPVLWLSLHCKQPPPEIMTLLQLRLVIGPPLVITIEILLFTIGLVLGVHGFRRVFQSKYRTLETNYTAESKSNVVRKKSLEKQNVVLNVIENFAFRQNENMAKEAVSLLAVDENDKK